MSTHAIISIIQDNNTVASIYLHADGYPRHAGYMLGLHYNSYEKATNLIKLGDLSSLDASIECPKDHSFDNRVEGYTVAYYRDRHETWDAVCPSVCSISEFNQDDENHYVFYKGRWETYGSYIMVKASEKIVHTGLITGE